MHVILKFFLVCSSLVSTSAFAQGVPGADAVSYVPLFNELLKWVLFYALIWGLVLSAAFPKHPVKCWWGSWTVSLIGLLAVVSYMGAHSAAVVVQNAVSIFGVVGFLLGLPYSLGFSIGWLLNKVYQKHKKSR